MTQLRWQEYCPRCNVWLIITSTFWPLNVTIANCEGILLRVGVFSSRGQFGIIIEHVGEGVILVILESMPASVDSLSSEDGVLRRDKPINKYSKFF